jgi:hypothetical protein
LDFFGNYQAEKLVTRQQPPAQEREAERGSSQVDCLCLHGVRGGGEELFRKQKLKFENKMILNVAVANPSKI